jgi:hypothetical protein
MSWIDKLEGHARRSVKKSKAQAPDLGPPPEVQEVIVTVRHPRENDPGEVAFGYFTVVGDILTMTDQRGKPLDDKEVTCRLPPNINPKSVAASFTKKRWPETRGGFNRKIDYPEIGWC